MQVKFKAVYILFILILLSLMNCTSDNDGPIDNEPEEVSPVVFDINAVPYGKLSDYNFFKMPMANLEPVYGVLPFEPASQLFTDYAEKKRFLLMANGTSANYIADNKVFEFPSGTVLIKNFYYQNVMPNHTKKIIETRLMIRKGQDWIFANYIWNDAQTEAVYNMEGGIVPIEWMHNGEAKTVDYKIPNQNECFMCHFLNNKNSPIGPKPQNVNFALNYADGLKNQIDKWEEFGYLNSGTPSEVVSIVDYNDSSKSLDLRMRSYIEINCAHCHIDGGYAAFYPVRFGFSADPDIYAMGACMEPNIDIGGTVGDEVDHIISIGNHEKSGIYHRMNSINPMIKMPMIGTTLIHEEAVTMTANWIDGMEGECF